MSLHPHYTATSRQTHVSHREVGPVWTAEMSAQRMRTKNQQRRHGSQNVVSRITTSHLFDKSLHPRSLLRQKHAVAERTDKRGSVLGVFVFGGLRFSKSFIKTGGITPSDVLSDLLYIDYKSTTVHKLALCCEDGTECPPMASTWGRYGHEMHFVKERNELFVFGGESAWTDNSLFMSTFRISLTENDDWMSPSVIVPLSVSQRPPARLYFSSVFIPPSSKSSDLCHVVIYGGQDKRAKRGQRLLHDMWLLELSTTTPLTSRWQRINICRADFSQSANKGASMVYWNRSLYTFGGTDGGPNGNLDGLQYCPFDPHAQMQSDGNENLYWRKPHSTSQGEVSRIGEVLNHRRYGSPHVLDRASGLWFILGGMTPARNERDPRGEPAGSRFLNDLLVINLNSLQCQRLALSMYNHPLKLPGWGRLVLMPPISRDQNTVRVAVVGGVYTQDSTIVPMPMTAFCAQANADPAIPPIISDPSNEESVEVAVIPSHIDEIQRRRRASIAEVAHRRASIDAGNRRANGSRRASQDIHPASLLGSPKSEKAMKSARYGPAPYFVPLDVDYASESEPAPDPSPLVYLRSDMNNSPSVCGPDDGSVVAALRREINELKMMLAENLKLTRQLVDQQGRMRGSEESGGHVGLDGWSDSRTPTGTLTPSSFITSQLGDDITPSFAVYSPLSMGGRMSPAERSESPPKRSRRASLAERHMTMPDNNVCIF